ERNRVRELLDNPNLTRILVVVDEIGGNGRERVESLGRRSPRIESSFGRISAAQGIAIDPRFPGKATVFPVGMSADELHRCHGDLSKEFPSSSEDVAAEPDVVTQLSGIGQVAILPGTTATDLRAQPGTAAPLTAMRAPDARAKTVEIVHDR